MSTRTDTGVKFNEREASLLEVLGDQLRDFVETLAERGLAGEVGMEEGDLRMALANMLLRRAALTAVQAVRDHYDREPVRDNWHRACDAAWTEVVHPGWIRVATWEIVVDEVVPT